MGLTIHYHGRFRRNGLLPEMIDEIRDFAEIQKWDYHVFEHDFRQRPFIEAHDG